MRKKNGDYSAEYSFCENHIMKSYEPIDMFDLLNGNETAAKKSMSLAGDEVTSTFRNVLDVHHWLPFASEQYLTSAKLSDYIVVPTSIMTTELPNRNGVGFPFEELSAFNHEHGKLAYKTWQGKPTFEEHCFPSNTTITLKDGKQKKIKDIKVGDNVLTHTGRFMPVTKLFNNGKKSMRHLKVLGNLHEFFVTPNHPLWVVAKQQLYNTHVYSKMQNKNLNMRLDLKWSDLNPHWRPASDVYIGDYLVAPILIGGTKSVDIDFAFLIGTYMAEGNLNYYTNAKSETYAQQATITINRGEKEYREKIEECCEKLGYKYSGRYGTGVNKNTYIISILDREFSEQCHRLCGNYSHKKYMKEELRLWDEESLKWFLGGYLTGDGCIQRVGKHGNTRLRLRTTSKKLALDLQHALAFLGIPPTANNDGQAKISSYFCDYYKKDRIIKSRKSYMVSASGGKAGPILNDYYVGKSKMTEYTHPRTWEKILVIGNYILFPIDGIQDDAKKANTYNFEVEEDHSYVAYGCVVHNCNSEVDKAKGIILDSAMQRLTRFEGDLWQVVLLNSFDRRKDAELANRILNKESTGYSMGAWVRDYECSICGTSLKKTDGKGCRHVKKGQPEFSVFDGSLAYLRAIDPIGFECSSVAVPAYVQAVNPNYLQ